MENPANGDERTLWKSGHRFRLLVDGSRFFPTMLESIRQAQRYVLLEMYLVESGELATRFIAALCDAASRGVQVYLLFDGYGSLRLSRGDRDLLMSEGAHLLFYNPLRFSHWQRNLFRNHRKLLLVDGVLAYTGGFGLKDLFDPSLEPEKYWHDVVLKIEGPSVETWQALFMETWNRWSRIPLQLPEPPAVPTRAGVQRGRVAAHSRYLKRSEIKQSFVSHIRQARQRVWLSTAYFVPSAKLRRALIRAAGNGVDVRLMLPGPYTDHPEIRWLGRYHYERMLRNGVRIFEYQPRFLHAKVIMCDHWVSIGSANGDRWNEHWNLEANQEVEDSAVIEAVEAFFEEDFLQCIEFEYTEWRIRPWYHRLWERFLGKVVTIVAWFWREKRNPPQ
ncbi:phospholipase D-like domain-containing protein [Desulfuromonas sp. AOP6]|uniref:phospholipase D-like domain-containing protein n=1 Tax=Desulfuromonas sp. AOP6 TaxID=1566351 RepID=UPI0012800202|nr:phospholipase D-like domain-containing protein [Desulfuromonas sp. AOP6]BCA81028.1 cardiolipin synthase B [Desulfuromonas sp. AOP6]